jgi:protein involved in polysaccharide export with SLBB domain
MTASQLQTEIAQQLVQLDLIKEPNVQVGIEEYRAHTVYILGEVIMPGQFLITHDMYLMDLLSLSQGFNDVASPVGYLYRTAIDTPGSNGNEAKRESSTDEAIEIDFKQLYDGTKQELNVKLRGGDVLYVPQRRQTYFFVVGDVRLAGAFDIQFNQLLLATQAIAKAGGPNKTAKMSKGILVRYNQNGERQEQSVDFKAILEGKKPDFQILPKDIIFIPGSSAKTLAYGLMGIIPRIATTVAVMP